MNRLAIAIPLFAALAAQPARAQATDSLDTKAAAFIRDRYLADMDSTHVKMVALAKAIPAEKYSWRPSAGVRSVSEVLMHVVSEWYFYGPRSLAGHEPADFLKAGQKPNERMAELEKTTAKTEVLAQLEKSWAYNKAQFLAADPAKLTGKYKPWGIDIEQAAFSMTGDQHEHLGQLIAYARSIGVKPPWSK